MYVPSPYAILCREFENLMTSERQERKNGVGEGVNYFIEADASPNFKVTLCAIIYIVTVVGYAEFLVFRKRLFNMAVAVEFD